VKEKEVERNGHGCAQNGGRRGGGRRALGSTVARAGGHRGRATAAAGVGGTRGERVGRS
jgi:hypothetical protein